MKVWAIIDREEDNNNNPYILFHFEDGVPILNVFDIRHKIYADAQKEKWNYPGGHPNAEVVIAEIIFKS